MRPKPTHRDLPPRMLRRARTLKSGKARNDYPTNGGKETAMTVAELIAYLQTQPQELQVAYECFSELCLLESRDIEHVEACEPRPDGWIQEKRPDMPVRRYLMFPGN